MTATILHLPQTPVAELTIADVRRLRPLVSQAATETLGRLDALPITADRTALETRLRKLERVEKDPCNAIQTAVAQTEAPCTTPCTPQTSTPKLGRHTSKARYPK